MPLCPAAGVVCWDVAQPGVRVNFIAVVVSLQNVSTGIPHFSDPLLHTIAIQVEHEQKDHPHEPQHQPQENIGCLQGEVSRLRLDWDNTPIGLDTEPPQPGVGQRSW